ncbi:MAG: hypothetical protein NTV51_00315 [Verrucomicrobia bacterium]|nr:hypothetical protein [Verrucomicrobiota bacterium]
MKTWQEANEKAKRIWSDFEAAHLWLAEMPIPVTPDDVTVMAAVVERCEVLRRQYEAVSERESRLYGIENPQPKVDWTPNLKCKKCGRLVIGDEDDAGKTHVSLMSHESCSGRMEWIGGRQVIARTDVLR